MSPTSHLDDETLSAFLDGEVAGDERAATAAHVDACTTCRARLDAFRAVAVAVAAPVTPPLPEIREAAIAAATHADRPATRRNRNLVPALAMAAVVLALLVAAPLVWRATTGDDSGDFATAGKNATNALDDAASAPLTDLGALHADTLAATVGARLGVHARNARTPTSAPVTPSTASAMAGNDSAAPAAPGAGAVGGGAAGSTEAGGTASATGAAPAEATSESARRCEPTLNAAGELVLAARGSWDDQPAVVLAYRDGDSVTAYVVDPPDCRILHFVRFRAES